MNPTEQRLGRVTEQGAVDVFDSTRAPVPSTLPVDTWVLIDAVGVVHQLAEPKSALAESIELAANQGLDPTFPLDVQREAAAWEASPGIDDPALTDHTDLPFVTIDEQTSKDLDQAVFAEQTDTGFTVWYAIADAAHYVRPGMALWDEALRRGATAYLPGLIVPMLPKVLSEDIISLNEGVDRRSVLFEMRLAPDGTSTQTVMHRSRVRVRCKTWFDAVQAFYDGGPCPSQARGVRDNLLTLQTVGRLRIALAAQRQMASYRRRPLDIRLPHAAARRFVALTGLRNAVERYNEQISILANVEGARILRDGTDNPSVQAIYRVHASPPERAVSRFRKQLDAFRRAHDLTGPEWTWSDTTPLATWLEELPRDGEPGRLARAVHRMALMMNTRSTFQSEPAKHHGVGAAVYSRFTAPMREVVGIFVHKELCELLGWAQPNTTVDDDILRDSVIDVSHRARSRQSGLDRSLNRIVIDQLFAGELDRVADERTAFPAMVLGLTQSKVHVQLDQAPLDVKVYTRHLEAQYGRELHVDPSAIALRDPDGKPLLAVGDSITLTVHDMDREQDRWQLRVLRTESSS